MQLGRFLQFFVLKDKRQFLNWYLLIYKQIILHYVLCVWKDKKKKVDKLTGER